MREANGADDRRVRCHWVGEAVVQSLYRIARAGVELIASDDGPKT
jgi:hypothetical protein